MNDHEALWRDGEWGDAYAEGYAHGQVDGSDSAIEDAVEAIAEAVGEGDISQSVADYVIELIRTA